MVRGQIDEANRAVLRGWAHDDRRPGQPVSLLVTLDGALLGRVVANRFRQDLLDAGFGSGRHGFELRFETVLSPLRPHQLRVTIEENGVDLPRSPWVLPAADVLDDADLARLGDLLLDGLEDDPAGLERRTTVLIGHLDRLLASRNSSVGAVGWRNARQADPLSDVRDGSTLMVDTSVCNASASGVFAADAAGVDEAGSDEPRSDEPGSCTDGPDGPEHGTSVISQSTSGRLGSGLLGAGGQCPTARMLALVVDEVMPDGDRDAGSNAILSHMRSLRRLGYHVLFAAADPVPNPTLAAALLREGIESCGTPFYATIEEVLRRHGATLAVVYLHRGSLGSRYGRLVRHHCRHARLLLSVADLQHLRLKRQAKVEHRDELLMLARQAELQELDAMLQADAVLTHSAAEANAIATALPGKPVHRLMWTASTRPISTPFPARYGVAFLADYRHAPNLDAARRLVREIMPLVWEHEPLLPCLLAGSHLPRGLDGDDPRVRWIGHVPAVQSLFERVRLSVAPLAFGAGIKGKVLDSLAAGVPCVCSPIAAEGLLLTPALEAMVAGDTHGIARLIVQLHRDPALNAEIARAGLDWAAEHLSDTVLDAAMKTAIALPEPAADRPAG